MHDTQRKTGLALGSGAARGMAHIGVLKVLEKTGIRIDAIAGTSIGACIGALYAAGVSVGQMEEVARNVDWRQLAKLLDPTLPTSGLIDGRKVASFMAELLPVHTFEELHIPLAVVATDVETGEMLIIKKGNLLQALQAAIAFPGIFTPVRFGDRFLVDGGLCNPVPVDVVRALGADFVIGVCAIPEVNKAAAETYLPPAEADKEESRGYLSQRFNTARVESILRDILGRNGSDEKNGKNSSRRERKPPGIFRVCAQSVVIMENEINQLRLERNDIDLLIRPDLNSIALLDFHRAGEAIQAGENAAGRVADRLRALAKGH
jgi:NTE family protein